MSVNTHKLHTMRQKYNFFNIKLDNYWQRQSKEKKR